MNDYTDFGSMQRAAQKRVYEMQRRAAYAMNGGQQMAARDAHAQPMEQTKRRSCSEVTNPPVWASESRGYADTDFDQCAPPQREEECQGAAKKKSGLLGAIASPDKLLKSMPDEYLLLLVLVMLIRERCDIMLILAIIYLML